MRPTRSARVCGVRAGVPCWPLPARARCSHPEHSPFIFRCDRGVTPLRHTGGSWLPLDRGQTLSGTVAEQGGTLGYQQPPATPGCPSSAAQKLVRRGFPWTWRTNRLRLSPGWSLARSSARCLHSLLWDGLPAAAPAPSPWVTSDRQDAPAFPVGCSAR